MNVFFALKGSKLFIIICYLAIMMFRILKLLLTTTYLHLMFEIQHFVTQDKAYLKEQMTSLNHTYVQSLITTVVVVIVFCSQTKSKY